MNALAVAIAAGLEAARSLDEERVRQIATDVVRAELAKLGAGTGAGWLTPPQAAKAEGCSVKRVRQLIAAGKVETRLRNLDATSKAKKYEVRVDSLRAALRGGAVPPQHNPTEPIDATAWAARRLAKGAA